MSKMTPEFDKIDAILLKRGQTKLTDEEKVLIENTWKQEYIKWTMTPKATTHEDALKTQIIHVLSNVVHDVLSYTRKK